MAREYMVVSHESARLVRGNSLPNSNPASDALCCCGRTAGRHAERTDEANWPVKCPLCGPKAGWLMPGCHNFTGRDREAFAIGT